MTATFAEPVVARGSDCFVESRAEACQALAPEAAVDQDSERTSSLLAPGKSSAVRRHSKTPGPGIVAGINELDALGTLSLRPSQANVVPVEQPSILAEPGADARHGDASLSSCADDRTIVAHSGRGNVDADIDAARQSDDSLPSVREINASSSGVASSGAHSGVNPKRALQGRARDKAVRNAQGHSKSLASGHRLAVQWACAGATLLTAAWYVLQQPPAHQPERHWVSGRSR